MGLDVDCEMLELSPTNESDEPIVRGITGGWTNKLGALAELFNTTGGNGND